MLQIGLRVHKNGKERRYDWEFDGGESVTCLFAIPLFAPCGTSVLKKPDILQTGNSGGGGWVQGPP